MNGKNQSDKCLVVFDVAGTTVVDDDLVADSFISAFEATGQPVPLRSAVDRLMGTSKRTAISTLLGKPPWDPIVQTVLNAFLTAVGHAYKSRGVREIPGTTETFRRLREAGHKVALDTGFPRIVLDAILGATGWVDLGLIAGTCASNEVLTGRPAPYMIFRLMEELEFTRVSQVVKVGDTLVDLEEGINAGCGLVVGVTSGTCSVEDFEASPWAQAPNVTVVDDVTHVPRLLG